MRGDPGTGNIERDRRMLWPLPWCPAASRPDPWLADLKPFRPYVYRGLGFDIFNPDEEDNMPWSAEVRQP